MENATSIDPLDSFEHVVVLMLENRSFDNLLGYLHEGGVPDGKTFDGLQNNTVCMPVPTWASDYAQHPFVAPMHAKDYHQPFPDPGEVYQHINTQLYNHIDTDNRKVAACKMQPPFNIPTSGSSNPSMLGFIKDYINTLEAIECKECEPGKENKECKACEGYHDPSYDQYSAIMQCYTASQVSILSTLAKQFAVFDHWYCSVPSQTWCNRAFWHAGTSGGKVVNPTDECGVVDKIEAMYHWIKDVWSQETIFKRMNESGVSHGVYTSGPVPLTALVNGFDDTNIHFSGEDLSAFKQAIDTNTLPQYAFIEPKFYGEHNDQHPSSAGSAGPFVDDGPTRNGSVLLGEHLIWDVYNTIQQSNYSENTLLIITYDEHGGCFDHVAPPPANDQGEVIPPTPDMVGQEGFNFRRLGLRVPMVMVSAYIQPNTIVNDVFEHTSFIKTMCNKWKMNGLTDRDKNAPSFESVFSTEKRKLPTIDPPSVNKLGDDAFENDPLNDLQKSILVTAHYIASQNQKKTDAILTLDSTDKITTVKQAVKYLERIQPLLSDIH